MLVHGVGTVVTMNVGDFDRFGAYISVLKLEAGRSWRQETLCLAAR